MRQSIRDRRSNQNVQPRVMDYVRGDDGVELLETKSGNITRSILFEDFVEQVREARHKSEMPERSLT